MGEPTRVKTRLTERERSAIDIHRESLVPVAGIPAYLQSLGALPPHKSTVQRWISEGVGRRRLSTIRIGGRCYTSKEALARFVEVPQ